MRSFTINLTRRLTHLTAHAGMRRPSEAMALALTKLYVFGGGQVQQHEALTRRLVQEGILTPPGPNARPRLASKGPRR